MAVLLAQIGALAGVVVGIGCIALGGFLLFKGFFLLARKAWGWDGLAREFPPPPSINKSGDQFRGGGFVGGPMRFSFQGWAKPFTIEPALEGLLITASFAKGVPIFIPWTEVREASWLEGSVGVITIEHKRCLQFYLPQDAGQIVQANIAAERFHKESFGDLLRGRLSGR